MNTSIRRIALGVAAAASVLSLAACGVAKAPATGGGEPAALSDEPVTLRVMWWGGDARHERTQKVFDLFEEKHPNITIEPEFSDWNGYWEKLATATAGGNAADVMQMDQVYLASYADRGSLVDLGQYADQLKTDGLEESVLDMGKWDDKLYAMPISTTSTAAIVNLDVIDQVGVPLPDTSTWTWDEFGEWAAAVSAASGGSVYGTGQLGNEYQLQLFARQHGDALFTDGKISIKPETLAAYFQLGLDWIKSGAAPSASYMAEQASLPIDQSDFSVGKATTVFTSSTLVTAYAAASGANLELVPIPTLDGDKEKYDYFKPGMYWSASSKSEHPAEAALLIDFLVNDPEAGAIIGTERGIPANSDVIDALGDSLTAEEQKTVAFAESRRPKLGDAPAIVPNGASDVQTILLRYQQEVNFERQTPIAAAEAMIAEITASITAAAG
ncbi:ABC transporter substrate-binding protein [Microbacterium stercoris]|uniref:Extracellular solute-binding protein n=1 Tax=Microbacterium stercoris TaxID=2820289 RepID=A0A939QH33_9MICO|nr:extracellular solute-binding protein [Microbacterium stercoris]MBO3662673.1 extracellular solute-binding protein [Microbacterium stercoris]